MADKEVVKQEQQQVTKVRNEGRVQAGKRLAEWNRKNKESLKSTTQVPNQVLNQVPA